MTRCGVAVPVAAYGELATLSTWRDADNNMDFTTSTWPDPSGGDTTTWTYDSANRLSVRTWARGGGLDRTYGAAQLLGQDAGHAQVVFADLPGLGAGTRPTSASG